MSFNTNANCLKTKNGYMVNFHGFCFFVNENFVYQPWKRTIEKGELPTTNEYGRLRGLQLAERKLSDVEEAKSAIIAQNLKGNPRYGLGKLNKDQKPPRKVRTIRLGEQLTLPIAV